MPARSKAGGWRIKCCRICERSRRPWMASRKEERPFDKLRANRSEEHTSELQSLMRISYAVFCLKKKNHIQHPLKYKNAHITKHVTNTLTIYHYDYKTHNKNRHHTYIYTTHN